MQKIKTLMLVLAIWPGSTLALSCGKELEDMKKKVEKTEKQCKKQSSNKAKYEKELKKIESKYKDRFAKLSKQRATEIDKLQTKYNIK